MLRFSVPLAIHRGHLRKVTLTLLSVAAIVAATTGFETHAGDAAIPRGVLILLAIFVAAVIASIAGFAFSALAGAMLAHLYDDPVEMVRVMLLASIVIQAYCSLMVVRSVPWREVTAYLVGGLLTLPLGLYLLTRLPARHYALALGLFLVAYALYALAKPMAIDVRKRSLDACVGALGGITGGAAAFPGAFVVIWCSARGLPKEAQRAICQPYIFIMQIAALGALEFGHREPSTRPDLYAYWTIVPVALLAAYCGCSIFQRISTGQFKTVVLTLLVASGSLLIAKAW